MLKISLVNDSNSHANKEDEKLEELYPTFYEWKTIKEIGLTYPSMCNLKEMLENDFSLMETEEGQNCRNIILEDLETRWEFPQELCLKGSFFDPRFKSLDFIKSQQICNNVIKKLHEEYKILKPVKDEFQHYLSLSELPALEEYDPFK